MTEQTSTPPEPSWHDNLIYGLYLLSADPDRGLWRSDLVLDIDHIAEWIRDGDGGVRFRVAPATLTFHDVTDLKIDLDFGGNGHPHTLNELSIAEIIREADDPRPGGRPYFRWRIALNLPEGGVIAFGASGYTQSLRAEPLLIDGQRLATAERPPLVV